MLIDCDDVVLMSYYQILNFEEQNYQIREVSVPIRRLVKRVLIVLVLPVGVAGPGPSRNPDGPYVRGPS